MSEALIKDLKSCIDDLQNDKGDVKKENLWKILEALSKYIKNCIDDVQNDKGDVEKNYEDLRKILEEFYENRKMFRQNKFLSYSIPNMKLICHIVKFLEENNCKQVIEIGSGTGLWASLIQIICKRRENNIIFIPTEDKIISRSYRYEVVEYTKIEDISADEAIKNYKNSDCLFLCWPPSQYMVDEDEVQYSAGKMLVEFKGNYLIYIGENKKDTEDKGDLPITGDFLFHDELEENWIEIEEKCIKMFITGKSDFHNIYENMQFFYRKLDIIYDEVTGKEKPMYVLEDKIRDTLFEDIKKGKFISDIHTEINKEKYLYNYLR